MSINKNTILIVLLSIFVLAAVVGTLLGFLMLPMYLHARQEAAYREQCNNEMRQIAKALDEFNKKCTVNSPPNSLILPFDVYSGYFVSNQFEPDAAESYVTIANQEQFDKIFGVAMVKGDKSHRLPPDVFKSNLILAVIKRGNAVWEYTIQGINLDDGVVTLRYSTTSKPSDSATYSSPLIVSIPKSVHVAVQFIENDKPMKKLEE
jgi:hypothetical protein